VSIHLKISVVLLTYNRAELLKKTLMSLVEQEFARQDFEVIVTDDGSTDNTWKVVREFIQSRELNIRYLANPHSGGVRALNNGIREAQGEFCLFLEDDVTASAGLLKEHYSKLRIHPKVSVVGAIELHPSLKGDKFTSLVMSTPSYVRKKMKSLCYVPDFFFTATNASVPSSIIKETLFDESFRYGYADTDVALRLGKKGCRFTYNPRAKVFHMRKTSPEEMWEKKYSAGLNFLKLRVKHPDTTLLTPLYRQYMVGIKLTPMMKPFIGMLKDVFRSTYSQTILRILLAYYKFLGARAYERTRMHKIHSHGPSPTPDRANNGCRGDMTRLALAYRGYGLRGLASGWV